MPIRRWLLSVNKKRKKLPLPKQLKPPQLRLRLLNSRGKRKKLQLLKLHKPRPRLRNLNPLKRKKKRARQKVLLQLMDKKSPRMFPPKPMVRVKVRQPSKKDSVVVVEAVVADVAVTVEMEKAVVTGTTRNVVNGLTEEIVVVDTEAAETAEIIVAVAVEATATTAKMKMALSLRLEKNPETLAATIITAVIEETVVTAVVIVAVAAVIVAVEVAAVVVVPTLLGMMAVMPKTNQLQLKLLDRDRNEEKNLNKTENANVIFKRQQLEFVKVSAMEMQIKELFESYLKMID